MLLRIIITFICCLTASLLQAASPASTPSEIMPLAEKSLLLDITRIDGKIIAVGERGHILISRDNGNTWKQVITPTRATLNSIFFSDEKFGWAVGHSGVILDSNNGGETWSQLSTPNPETTYMDAYFSNEWEGVIVGSYGDFGLTHDAGVTIEKEWLNDYDLHYHAVTRSPNGTLYIVGEAGQIFKSTNKGKSWTQLESPYNGSFFGVLCLDDKNLIVFGLRGHVFRSNNAGKTWTEIKIEFPLMITSGIELSDGSILLASVRDKVFISKDRGISFNTVTLPQVNGTVSLIEAADKSIIFCGKSGITKIDIQQITGTNQIPE